MPLEIRVTLRLAGDLADQIENERHEAGEQKLSATLRRLLHRGLGHPAMLPSDRQLLTTIARELRPIGTNLNQLAMKAHVRDVRTEVAAQEIDDGLREIDALKNRLTHIASKYE